MFGNKKILNLYVHIYMYMYTWTIDRNLINRQEVFKVNL